jgi:hypothetical protein
MNLDQLLERYDRKFPENGEYILQLGQSIAVQRDTTGISDKRGVYLIYGKKRSQHLILLNIGRSGTLMRNGQFKKQTLLSRLTKGKQHGLYRPTFFIKEMEDGGYNSLKFQWFVTFNDKVKALPAFAEAELLQAFYSERGRLPEWNRSF